MATFNDAARAKFEADVGLVPDDTMNPRWLEQYVAAKKARLAEEQAARVVTAPTAATPDAAAAQGGFNLTMKRAPSAEDPNSPENYFSPENIARLNLDERVDRYKTWMKTNADTYLTETGKKQYAQEFKRKGQDNLFGVVSEAGVLEGARDLGISGVQGAVGSFGEIASLFGADNPVASSLKNIGDKLGTYKSDESKVSAQAVATRIQEALDSGSTSEQVAAYLNALAESPGEALMQGIGSIVTFGFGKAAQAITATRALAKGATVANAATAAAKAATATNRTVGAVQGLGVVKSAQFDSVQQELLKLGASPEMAADIASKSQEFNLNNLPQQALGAILGLVASGVGVEGALVRAGVRKQLGTAAAPAPGVFSAGGAKAIGGTALKEWATEAPQGAQEQLAGNIAAVDAGLLEADKKYQGVAGAGALEGTVGAILGGGVGIASARAGTAPTLPPGQPSPTPTPGQPSPTPTPAQGQPTGVVVDTPPVGLVGIAPDDILQNPPTPFREQVLAARNSPEPLSEEEIAALPPELPEFVQSDKEKAIVTARMAVIEAFKPLAALPDSDPAKFQQQEALFTSLQVRPKDKITALFTPEEQAALLDGNTAAVQPLPADQQRRADAVRTAYMQDIERAQASQIVVPQLVVPQLVQPTAAQLPRQPLPEGSVGANAQRMLNAAFGVPQHLVQPLSSVGAERNRTYDDVQKEIDNLEDIGINKDANKLNALYKERDAIGENELKQFYVDIEKILKSKGFSDSEVKAIANAYFIDLEKFDAVTQARVSDLPKYIAGRTIPTQVRDVAIKLAINRKVSIDDETDLKSAEVIDASKAVKVFLDYFNLPYTDTNVQLNPGSWIIVQTKPAAVQPKTKVGKQAASRTQPAPEPVDTKFTDGLVFERAKRAWLATFPIGNWKPLVDSLYAQIDKPKNPQAELARSLLQWIKDNNGSRKLRADQTKDNKGASAAKTLDDYVADREGDVNEPPAMRTVAVGEAVLPISVVSVGAREGAQAALIKLAATTKNQAVAKTATKLAPFLGPVRFQTDEVVLDAKGRSGRAGYYPRSRRIVLSEELNGEWTDIDLLHEAAHAATDKLLHTDDRDLTTKQVEAKQALQSLLSEVQSRPELEGSEGTADLGELVAEFYANAAFRQKLVDIGVVRADGQTTLLQRLVDAIRDLLGLRTPLKSSDYERHIEELFDIPEPRVNEQVLLRINEATPSQLSVPVNATLSVAEKFQDHAARFKYDVEREIEKAQANGDSALVARLEAFRKEFVLRDVSSWADTISKEIMDPLTADIKQTADAAGLDPADLANAASDYAAAKYARSRNQQIMDERVLAAQHADDSLELYEAAKTLIDTYSSEVNSVAAKADALYARVMYEGNEDMMPDAVLNRLFNEMRGLVDKISTDLETGLGFEVGGPKFEAARRLGQSLRKRNYTNKTPGDMRRITEAALRFRDDLYLMRGVRKDNAKGGTMKAPDYDTVKANRDQEAQALAELQAAHAMPRIIDAKGDAITAVPLIGGLRNSEADQIIADTEASPKAAVYLGVAAKIVATNEQLMRKAVDLGIVPAEVAQDYLEKYPGYVSLKGRHDATVDDVLIESNAKNFLAQAEGAVHYKNYDSAYTNLHVRVQKLAAERANVALSAAVHDLAVNDGPRLFERTRSPYAANKPYIKYKGEDGTFFYTPTTNNGIEAFTPRPAQKFKGFTTAISITGRTITTWVALFAPVLGFADAGTRGFNFVGRKGDLVRPDGSSIGVDRARASFLFQLANPSTWSEALSYAWAGKKGLYMDEFIATGGHLTYHQHLKTEEDVRKTLGNSRFNKMKNAAITLSETQFKWAQGFENVVSLASYKALRTQGMSARDAGFVTLDMMNFRNRGTLTNHFLRPFYLFANPAAQDAAQFKRSIVHNGKINMRAIGEIAVLAGVAAAMYAMARAEDDDDGLGGKKIDSLSPHDTNNNIVWPRGDGTYTKVRIGFGWMQTAWQLGVEAARYDAGLTTSAEWTANSTATVLKNFIVTGAPEVEFTKHPITYMVQALSPDLLAPLANMGAGITGRGTPIRGRLDPERFASEQGNWRTQEAYKEGAKNIRAFTGVDMAPESLRFLAESYLLGPLRGGLDTFVGTKADRADKGRTEEASMPTWQRSLGFNKVYSAVDEAKIINTQFYLEKARMTAVLKEANSLAPKLLKRETSEEKALRLSAVVDTPAESFTALSNADNELEKLNRNINEVYKRYAAGEDVTGEFEDLARRELDIKRTFVVKIRGNNGK